ncbi:hypothetical protein DFQ28_004545 [Apophysomyces sp. BC1034]|nr:hypothetical protein DFQ29_001707 [Apophysomyces sp. BC1021]KAG0188654.1 hypothetical protein DFQ28_004545 [Apophysomyces sp. BC1034]
MDRVLSYLNRSELVHVALTCKTWSAVALSLLWSSFTFVREREFERVFAIMARHNTSHPYGSFVKYLDLTHADREFLVGPNIILLVTSLCPNIESITITFSHTRTVAPPTPLMLHNNRPVLPPIRRPGTSNPLPPATNRPPSARYNQSLPLAHFAHNCRNLRSIRLISYSPRSDDSVYEMAKYLRSGSLQKVVFSGCATLQSSTLCKLAITNPQLRHIEIMGNTAVSDNSVATIADRCGNSLEHLSIGNAHNLTDMSLRYIARRCRNIRQICMFNNPDELSEIAFSDIVRCCTTLQILSLSNARALGETFFEAVTERIENELNNINNQIADPSSGLQSICLGGVRRDIIHSPAVAKLINLSEAEADQQNSNTTGWDDDDDDDHPPSETNLSRMMENRAVMPRIATIRGSSIWWQRQQL